MLVTVVGGGVVTAMEKDVERESDVVVITWKWVSVGKVAHDMANVGLKPQGLEQGELKKTFFAFQRTWRFDCRVPRAAARPPSTASRQCSGTTDLEYILRLE